MLYQEFKEKTALDVTLEQFEKINMIYMNCGDDIDNQKFCAEYPKVADSKIVKSLSSQVDQLFVKVNRLTEKNEYLEKAYFAMVREYDAGSAREIAVKAYDDEFSYIRNLLNNNCDLEPKDRDYLINNL